jgi:hypothetical protein
LLQSAKTLPRKRHAGGCDHDARADRLIGA